MIDIQREKDEMDEVETRMQEEYEVDMRGQGYERCKWCDEWVYKEDIQNGLCEACVDDAIEETTVKEVIEYANANNDVFILLTQYLFNEEQVIDILKKEALEEAERMPELFKSDIKEYIDNDVSHYLDYLEKRGAL